MTPRDAPTSRGRSSGIGEVAIPPACVVVLAGLPATGKTGFARHLAEHHGFVHYDVERHPEGWPRPELRPYLDASPRRFLQVLRRRHARIVLDWGFPTAQRPIIDGLRVCGARIVWFSADVALARRAFARRGGISLDRFDAQIAAIRAAGLPGMMPCRIVETLAAGEAQTEPSTILRQIFGVEPPGGPDGAADGRSEASTGSGGRDDG